MIYLYVASASIVFFLQVLLIGKKSKSKSDFAFLCIVFCMFLYFIGLFVLNSGKTEFSLLEQLLLEFNEASIFLYGPLLWFYTLFLTQLKQKMTKNLILHIVPFSVSLVCLWAAVIFRTQTESSFRNMLLFLKLVSILSYTIVILRMLKKHDLRIRDYFSNLDDKKLNWLQLLSQSILVIVIIASLSLIIEHFTPFSLPQYGGLFTNLSLSLFVFVLGFFGLQQDFVFKDLSNNTFDSVKYSKSSLNKKNIDREFLRVENYMQSKKVYIESELNLETLSRELDLHPNDLSQIINTSTKSNFWDYVNTYRVEEVKALLLSDEIKSKTLLGIALSSGFSSKSTFNRVFKKHCGCTPSEYVRREETSRKD